MTKRMLIDSTHAEETRVVVLDDNRLEDYDVEIATRKQLKGNIYLAKVVRVEASLQAAFVEYGGNRHGFLAFDEIHPDYYQIPIADRQKLLAMQEAEARAAAAAEEAEDRGPEPARAPEPAVEVVPLAAPESPTIAEPLAGAEQADEAPETTASLDVQPAAEPEPIAPAATDEALAAQPDSDSETLGSPPPPPETVGGEAESAEDLRPQRIPTHFLRQYKIQEVIHRRQIILVQVVKEERGAKGAALTTYISLAGRYCVLMPNSPRGGGVSRKITAPADRRRLREITAELAIPAGMGLIVRTAGANRPKAEIRRDCEYLLRLWDEIRDTVMKSVAPALIYEEASLIKRAIRDVYSRDIEEVLVDGEAGFHAARDFMRTLMPTHARKVQLWKDSGRSLFSHERVEAELEATLSPVVPLRSGGSLVINQAEALVAIDVNSGRATRERNIEETALRTNLEAAEEAARQLRLRDLAGLIVIDFIDMEAKKHNAMVERRLKEALKNDRARVQIGHISHFGLLEMSRQRLRPSLTETSFLPCPHCAGTGHVRSIESAAVHLLRSLEEEASRRRAGELLVHASAPVTLYILNHKRDWLDEIETRHLVMIRFAADENQPLSLVRIEYVRGQAAAEPAAAPAPAPTVLESPGAEPAAVEAAAPETASAETASADGEPAEESEEAEHRRRRRRRRRRHRDEVPPTAQPVAEAASIPAEFAEQPPLPALPASEPEPPPAPASHGAPDRPQRRGWRDGRRRRPERKPATPPASESPPLFPPGPTPADPFADAALDLLDALETAAELGAVAGPQEDTGQPAESMPALPEPVPVVVAAEPPAAAPLPTAPEEPAPSAPAPSVSSAPVDDRPPQPALNPILVGAGEGEASMEKKRGWWRR